MAPVSGAMAESVAILPRPAPTERPNGTFGLRTLRVGERTEVPVRLQSALSVFRLYFGCVRRQAIGLAHDDLCHLPVRPRLVAAASCTSHATRRYAFGESTGTADAASEERPTIRAVAGTCRITPRVSTTSRACLPTSA